MSKAGRIIEEIRNADEIEIMEFNFDECFEYMREMEHVIYKLSQLKSEIDLNIKMKQQSLLEYIEIYEGGRIQRRL